MKFFNCLLWPAATLLSPLLATEKGFKTNIPTLSGGQLGNGKLTGPTKLRLSHEWTSDRQKYREIERKRREFERRERNRSGTVLLESSELHKGDLGEEDDDDNLLTYPILRERSQESYLEDAKTLAKAKAAIDKYYTNTTPKTPKTFENQVAETVSEIQEIVDATLKLKNFNEKDSKKMERLLMKAMNEINEFERAEQADSGKTDSEGEKVVAGKLEESHTLESTNQFNENINIKSNDKPSLKTNSHTPALSPPHNDSPGKVSSSRQRVGQASGTKNSLNGNAAADHHLLKLNNVHDPEILQDPVAITIKEISQRVGNESGENLWDQPGQPEIEDYAEEVGQLLGDISDIIDLEGKEEKDLPLSPSNSKNKNENLTLNDSIKANQITNYLLGIDIKYNKLLAANQAKSKKVQQDNKSVVKPKFTYKKSKVLNTPVWRAKLKDNARKQALKRLFDRSDKRKILR